MKKILITGALIAVISTTTFAMIQPQIGILSNNLISSIKNTATTNLTIEEGRQIIKNSLSSKKFAETKFSGSGPLLNRELALYLALQEIWITFSSQHNIWEMKKFSDVANDTVFAPYIYFSQKTGIIQWYLNGYFYPKSVIEKKELANIINNIINNKKQILSTYESIIGEKTEENEENLTLSAAPTVGPTITIEPAVAPEPTNTAENLLTKDAKKMSYTEIIATMQKNINEYRVANGLQPLVINHRLNIVANNYAKTMFETKHFAHKDKNGENVGHRALKYGYDYEIILENLGRGQKHIQQVMNELKKSPSHDKNLLNPKVREIGIGFHEYYWVQVFGKEF